LAGYKFSEGKVFKRTIPDRDEDAVKIETNEIVCIEETAITVRSYRRRTTVPSKIFHLLDLQPEDSLRWVGLRNGTVMITRVAGGKDREQKGDPHNHG